MKNKILLLIGMFLFVIFSMVGAFIHTMNDIKVYPSDNENRIIVESCGQVWTCDFIK